MYTMSHEVAKQHMGKAPMSSLAGQLPGTWTVVSHEALRPDGRRVPAYGASPKGIAVFDAGGRFVITVMRAGRAAYAADHPARGTAEEDKATAAGTMTYFGTYTVRDSEPVIDIQIEASSFPNWNGARQTRGFSIGGDELTLTVAALGGHAEVKWKRAT